MSTSIRVTELCHENENVGLHKCENRRMHPHSNGMILRNLWFLEMILEFGHSKTKSQKLMCFINIRDFQLI